MYTRCPSCRAEISFEPPVNATSLPDGYKHKIKCPSCGVTIAVKIPRLENTVQPVVVPQAPVAPVAPVGPTGPTGPCGPIGPRAPVAPVGPIGPRITFT
jgi:hypothetical protein